MTQLINSSQALPPVHKTKQMFDIEQAKGGQDIRLVLIESYNRLNSQAAIATELGVSQVTIDNWFSDLGIVVETQRIARLAETPQPVAA